MAPKRREPLWWTSRGRCGAPGYAADARRASGIRDENALESALARPRHRYAYARRADLPALAASYGYGLARNHPYRDGNKRTAFLVMVVFLELNGRELKASETEVVTMMLKLSAGELSEAALAVWLRDHLSSRS